MLSKKVLLPVALAAAAGTPYVLDRDWSETTATVLNAMLPEPEPAAAGANVSTYLAQNPQSAVIPSEFGFGVAAEQPRQAPDSELTGPPVQDFGEILRFDIDPRWVTSRWPRVTTTVSEANLQGLRVPVVTGTKVDDIAGSLTYYFDRSHRVQRISLEGYTGDERRLALFLTQHYYMQSEPTLHAAMYVARWNGAPFSVLRVARAPVISADSPHSSLHVLLELNRPSQTFGLSPRFTQLLEEDRQALRW